MRSSLPGKKSNGATQFAVALLFSVGAGYYFLRRPSGSMTLQDVERSPATRHMVGLADRVDKSRLRALLEEEDAVPPPPHSMDGSAVAHVKQRVGEVRRS